MAGEKQDGDAGTPASAEQSGAGYGNNALTDEVAQPGKDEDTMPNNADE